MYKLMFLTRPYALFFVLLFLIIPQFVKAQTGPVPFKLKSRIDFPSKTAISHVLPLDEGKKLLLVADKEARIWDVENGALIKSYSNNFSFRPKGVLSRLLHIPEYMVASPDGSKLITVEKSSGEKYSSAIISDLTTGNQTKLNGTLGETHSARFSRNGKIILTIHGDLKDIELKFWDGDTLKLRNSIRLNDLGWHYLSNDGRSIFIANGKANKWLNYMVMNYDASPNISLLDATSGKISTLFLAGNASSSTAISAYPKISSNEKYLAGVSDGKIFVWETNGNGSPKYEISPKDPNDRLDLLGFTTDGRYLMTSDGRKTGRLYVADTGNLAREFSVSGGIYQMSEDSRWAIIHDVIGSVSFIEVDDRKHSFTVSLGTAQESSDAANPFSGQEFETESADISPNGKFVMVSGPKK
jgi:WD40 repeat protein